MGAAAELTTLLRVPHYLCVFGAGLLFDWARIGIAFLGPYQMNAMTHSPRMVRLSLWPISRACLVHLSLALELVSRAAVALRRSAET